MVVFWLQKKITSDDSVKLDFGSSDVKYVADGDKQNAVSFNILLQLHFQNTEIKCGVLDSAIQTLSQLFLARSCQL